MRKLIVLLRKKILVLAALLLFGVLLLCGTFVRGALPVFRPSGVPERSVIVIDAGHGGEDGGAVAADGTVESGINLAIAQDLDALLRFLGCETRMTRTEDAAIYSDGARTLREKKASDLKNRAALVNETPNAVLLSIHQNCYPTAQPSGAQVLYSSNGKSEDFGRLMHDNLVNSLDPQNRRVAEPDKNRLYILSNVDCPAILVECGFVSNHSDITKLTDSRYQTALSTVLMASYLQFIHSNLHI